MHEAVPYGLTNTQINGDHYHYVLEMVQAGSTVTKQPLLATF